MKPKRAFQDIRSFFEETIWNMDQKLPKWKELFYYFFRLGSLVTIGIVKNRSAARAMALSYTTLLSLVPLLAVMMAFLKAFGGIDKITAAVEPFILKNLATGSGEIIQKYLAQFAQNIHAGALGIVGIGFLILIVVGLLSSIETAFNDIWGVRTKRSWFRRFNAYWAMVTIGPIFIAVSLGVTASLQSSHFVRTYLIEQEWISFFFKAAPYIMTPLLFTMLYAFMPNTKVKFRSALLGGILAGVLWEFAKVGYTIYVTQGVDYNSVYGSLSVLPVFLIWLYLTWIIVLVGAELAFADQHIKTYREERISARVSSEFKEFLALNFVACICDAYQREKGGVTSQRLTEVFQIPIRLINDILFNLCQAGILLEVGEEEHYYCPAKPMEKVTVKDVLLSLRSLGGKLRFEETAYTEYMTKIVREVEQSIEKGAGQKNFKEIVLGLSPSLKKSKL